MNKMEVIAWCAQSGYSHPQVIEEYGEEFVMAFAFRTDNPTLKGSHIFISFIFVNGALSRYAIQYCSIPTQNTTDLQ
jgi:hypothetical protein